jgi:hypothetical protein
VFELAKQSNHFLILFFLSAVREVVFVVHTFSMHDVT